MYLEGCKRIGDKEAVQADTLRLDFSELLCSLLRGESSYPSFRDS